MICITEKYLNNFVSQRRVIPGNQTYRNVVATEKKKTCIIGDRHFARITERSFGTGEERNFVVFKCFQMFKYLPILVDEKPESIILCFGSSDITKINYDNVNPDDLAQQIVNIAKKRRSFGVNNAISSILPRKNVSINKIIKKVNEENYSMCAAIGFHFICNDIIDVSMIWKNGLHLTNDVIIF